MIVIVEPSTEVASLKVTESSFTVTSFAALRNPAFRLSLSAFFSSSLSSEGAAVLLLSDSEAESLEDVVLLSSVDDGLLLSGLFGSFVVQANSTPTKRQMQRSIAKIFFICFSSIFFIY